MFSEPEDSTEEQIPTFFDRLIPADQASYTTLRLHVSRSGLRYNRFHRLDTLQTIFDEIRLYCLKGDAFDGTRCAICGIAWLPFGDIAINTRQLRILIAKSKSSINGAIAKMNFVTLALKDEEIERLSVAMPLLRGHVKELRQWTIRRPIAGEQVPQKESQQMAVDGQQWKEEDWSIDDNTLCGKWENEGFGGFDGISSFGDYGTFSL
jgi:hypothetical protein